MPRRAHVDLAALAASNPTATSGQLAELAGVSPARVRAVRAKFEGKRPRGPQRNPASTRSRQALGDRVIADAAAVGEDPMTYLDTARELRRGEGG